MCKIIKKLIERIMRIDLTYTVRGENPDPDPEVTAPTNMVVNNTSNTLSWTNSVGYSDTEHEYCIDYTGERTWRAVTSKPVSIGNVNLPSGDIAVRLKAIGDNEASEALISTEGFTSSVDIEPGENYFTLTEAENLAQYVYYALNSLDSGGNVAEDNESINTVVDLKGSTDMVYDGLPAPTLTGRPPVYSTYGLGSIWFDNEPLAQFQATIPEIVTPVEVSLTMLRQPGTAHEAWYNNGGIYAGDTGSGIRLAHADMPVVGSEAPPFFHISNIHVKFTASRADLWVNGEYQGFVDYTGRNEPNKITKTQIGVHTNNSQWEFIAYHLFPRELTESERGDFFSEASAKFYWGQEKQLPYAKDGSISRSGNNFTVNYTYVNPLGLPEDTSKTIYRWVGLGDGWLSNQNIMDGLGKTISLSQIPADVTQLKCEVQVFDIHGHTWKRIAGEWMPNIR